jgi:hypothetical protein
MLTVLAMSAAVIGALLLLPRPDTAGSSPWEIPHDGPAAVSRCLRCCCPTAACPCSIFERRYLDLVKTPCAAARVSASCASARCGGRTEGLPRLEAVGTVARIVDWDQLDNGLLGITVLGSAFACSGTGAPSGLCCAEVELLPELPPRCR